MPGVPEASKIEPSKDAGSPHNQVVCGRRRTPEGEDLQTRQAWRVVLLEALKEGSRSEGWLYVLTPVA
jgi:hypothetical protein